MDHFFTVKYGYRIDEMLSITGDELAQALYAQAAGTIFRGVGGKHIIAIRPDFHRHLRINREHELKTSDMRELAPGLKHTLEEMIDTATERAEAALGNGGNTLHTQQPILRLKE